jgi:hypothetical protein
MPDILFDRLTYIDRLQRGGVGEEQARVHADALNSALRDGVATHEDITAVRADVTTVRSDITLQGTSLRGEISTLRTEIRSEITLLRAEIRTQITELLLALTIRMGLIAAALFALLAGIKFFVK